MRNRSNDLDLCLEVVSSSCQPLSHQQPLEIEGWLQRTTNWKWHMGIKWSRDRWRHHPKRSNSSPQYA